MRAVADGRINLTWIDRASDEDGFHVYRRTGEAGGFTLLDTVPPDAEFYSDSSPESGIEQYKVTAFNSNGETDSMYACAP